MIASTTVRCDVCGSKMECDYEGWWCQRCFSRKEFERRGTFRCVCGDRVDFVSSCPKCGLCPDCCKHTKGERP